MFLSRKYSELLDLSQQYFFFHFSIKKIVFLFYFHYYSPLVHCHPPHYVENEWKKKKKK